MHQPSPLDLETTSIAQLQSAMSSGLITARALVRQYLDRIEALNNRGPRLNAVMETNPDAENIADALDDERASGRLRGPLHGVPILLKGNIDTSDAMQTNAGSLALLGAAPSQDATVAARLRAAGVIILGKTNLSEWANFRSTASSSGWCAVNGQSRNPYVLDRNPSGSSSGSGVAAAAALAAASIGTETDGSIVSPANNSGVVGIKPTVGLVSRAGVVPVSFTQDTVGPHARSVADAAAVLTGMVATAPDPRDPRTADAAGEVQDYTRFLDPNGLQGARIGVARNLGFGVRRSADAVMAAVITALQRAGAIIVDPADIPCDLGAARAAEITVLQCEFKTYIAEYLATRFDVALEHEGYSMDLEGLIAYNDAHAELEQPWFGQELFVRAQQTGGLEDPGYADALQISTTLGGPQGIDAIMQDQQLDALVAPTGAPAWPIDLVNGDHFILGSCASSAQAGYPIVTVPAAYCFELPVNVSFMGGRFSEPTLIRLAYAFERATQVRRSPSFLPTLGLDPQAATL